MMNAILYTILYEYNTAILYECNTIYTIITILYTKVYLCVSLSMFAIHLASFKPGAAKFSSMVE